MKIEFFVFKLLNSDEKIFEVFSSMIFTQKSIKLESQCIGTLSWTVWSLVLDSEWDRKILPLWWASLGSPFWPSASIPTLEILSHYEGRIFRYHGLSAQGIYKYSFELKLELHTCSCGKLKPSKAMTVAVSGRNLSNNPDDFRKSIDIMSWVAPLSISAVDLCRFLKTSTKSLPELEKSIFRNCRFVSTELTLVAESVFRSTCVVGCFETISKNTWKATTFWDLRFENWDLRFRTCVLRFAF